MLFDSLRTKKIFNLLGKTSKIPLPAAGFKKLKKDKLRDLGFKTII